jgi:cleavage stimulation factor subunit 3
MWCSYVRWEQEHDRNYLMEQIFGRTLLKVLNVELWSMYINYIRRRNSMTQGDVGNSYKIINEAFTLAIKTIGMDEDSGKLWQEYIVFLKSGPGTIGGTGWQDGAKVDAVRSAYQRAIAIPTESVTQLWREYDAFETSLSKINVRIHPSELQPAHLILNNRVVNIFKRNPLPT